MIKFKNSKSYFLHPSIKLSLNGYNTQFNEYFEREFKQLDDIYRSEDNTTTYELIANNSNCILPDLHYPITPLGGGIFLDSQHSIFISLNKNTAFLDESKLILCIKGLISSRENNIELFTTDKFLYGNLTSKLRYLSYRLFKLEPSSFDRFFSEYFISQLIEPLISIILSTSFSLPSSPIIFIDPAYKILGNKIKNKINFFIII